MIFQVTTSQTVYETYTVEAADRDEAVNRWYKAKAELVSTGAGSNDDELVIDVREAE